jgi:hypothetical protein
MVYLLIILSEYIIEIDLVAYLKFKANLQILSILLFLYSPMPYCTHRHKYGNMTEVILTCGSEFFFYETVEAREAWPGSPRFYLCKINKKEKYCTLCFGCFTESAYVKQLYTSL